MAKIYCFETGKLLADTNKQTKVKKNPRKKYAK